MAMGHQIDYLKYFEADSYAKFWYSDISVNNKKDWATVFMLDSFSKVFQQGGICGKRLLDIGTGPSIYSVISACRNFENIYLSDLAPQNREYLRAWLQDQEGTHDFSSIIKYIVDKESPRENWRKREMDLRKKIQGILPCDVSKDNPMSPSYFAQFDAVTSAQCLESASFDLASYHKYSSNVSSLIKPGGWIILDGCLGFQTYRVGGKIFRAAPTTLEDVERTWKNLGFEIITMDKRILTKEEKDILIDRDPKERETIQGTCVMTARKKFT